MKIEFCFRLVELRNKRKSSTVKNLFSSFFDNQFQTKDFQIKDQLKRFSPIRIFKIYSKKENQMNHVQIKDILDKIIFSSSNLFQNSTNLQVMNVVLSMNFSSNPTIKLRLKHDDWLFCVFTLSRPFFFICKMSKSLNFIIKIQSIKFDLFLSNCSKDEFFHWRSKQQCRNLLWRFVLSRSPRI